MLSAGIMCSANCRRRSGWSYRCVGNLDSTGSPRLSFLQEQRFQYSRVCFHHSIMSPASDPRTVPGNRVTTRARRITCESKCVQLYGSNWKTQAVAGTVDGVIVKNGKNFRRINANWEFTDRVRLADTHLGSDQYIPTIDTGPQSPYLSSPQNQQPRTANEQRLQITVVDTTWERM